MHRNAVGARARFGLQTLRVALALGLSVALSVVLVPTAQTARADTPPCTISATLVNSCRPWFGAESGNYGTTSNLGARMTEHEARIGRPLDIVHAYLAAGATALGQDMVTMAKRSNTIALINWRVASGWAQADGSNAGVNTQIDKMAASIKSLGSTRIMFTLYHEPESSLSRGGAPSCPNLASNGAAGTTTDYVNMWHNVRERFDAAGVSNVVWVMNYLGYPDSYCAAKDFWPGNDYVDWVMWDPYPKNTTWTARVGSFYNYMTANSDEQHDWLSKPWGLAEFGYVGSSQAAAYAMYDEAARNLANGVMPKLKAYIVWDNYTSSSHDDRVGYTADHALDPIEQQHYNALANDPLLNGPAVPEPTDQTPPTVSLTAPQDAATVSGPLSVTGTASDDVAVDQVQLLVDDDPVGTASPDGDGNVAIDWNSSTVANGDHSVRLWVKDTSGNTAVSDAVTVTVANVDEEAPSAPSDLTGVWSIPNKVTLDWTAAEDNGAVTGYRVYRDGDLLTTLGPEATEYVDDDVTNLSTYHYVVTAIDAADNESEPSNEVDVATGDDTPPSTPPGVSAVLTDDDQAMVTWSDSTDNDAVAGYRVYRNGSLLSDVDGSTTLLFDSGLDDATTYSYRIRAYDAAGHTSDLSDPAAVVTTPDTTAPSVPADLKAVSAPASVALTWKAVTDNVGVSNYIVYRDACRWRHSQGRLRAGPTTRWSATRCTTTR